MFIKNAFRLVINNLNLSYKTMLFRLIILIPTVAIILAICHAAIDRIVQSNQFTDLINCVGNLFKSFVSGDVANSVDVKPYFEVFVSFIRNSIPNLIRTLVIVSVIILVADFLLGICDFTTCVIVDEHMTSISKLAFVQTLIKYLKKSVPFELLYSFLKFVVKSVALAISILFAVLTSRYISIFSVIGGIWIFIVIDTLFYTYTGRLRPLIVHGKSYKEAFKNLRPPKNKLWYIIASYIFMIIFIAYFNITMLFATLGAGVFVSIPLSCMFTVCLQLVIDFAIDSKKYYIDFDTIIVPKELREDSEVLLKDVDI